MNRFAPGLKVVTYIGSKEERPAIQKQMVKNEDFNVVLTTYEVMCPFNVSRNNTSLITVEGYKLDELCGTCIL